MLVDDVVLHQCEPPFAQCEPIEGATLNRIIWTELFLPQIRKTKLWYIFLWIYALVDMAYNNYWFHFYDWYNHFMCLTLCITYSTNIKRHALVMMMIGVTACYWQAWISLYRRLHLICVQKYTLKLLYHSLYGIRAEYIWMSKSEWNEFWVHWFFSIMGLG